MPADKYGNLKHYVSKSEASAFLKKQTTPEQRKHYRVQRIVRYVIVHKG